MLEVFNFFKFFSFEDFIIVFFLYSFFTHVITTLVVELIWPTQYFNRKHNIGFNVFRLRTYTETLLKLRNKNSLYYVFFKFIFFNNSN